MFVKDMKSKRVRLGYGLRKAGVYRATFYRKMSGHPLAPHSRTEPDGSSSFRRTDMDRFIHAIKDREV